MGYMAGLIIFDLADVKNDELIILGFFSNQSVETSAGEISGRNGKRHDQEKEENPNRFLKASAEHGFSPG